MSDFAYAYTRPSALEARPEGNALLLSAFAEDAIESGTSCFFWGRLRNSWLAARGLSTLAKVVASRFVPQSAALRDPIVTAGAGLLRFEAFSSCNGVYARLDLGPDALDGEFLSSGTTNVDFNEPMVNALARISRTEPVLLSVGEKEVVLERAEGRVTERKVALPERWIKGLTAVQAYLALMEEKLRMTRVQAVQLVQGLPAGSAKTDVFLVLRGPRPSFSPVATAGAVRVGGAHRLRLLEGLLPLCEALRVYATPDGQASAFVLELGGGQQFVLALSADVWRGFSGEGNQLDALMEELPTEWIAGANNLFRGNETFNPTLFALENGLDPATVDKLCASLSAMGLLGFDLAENHYFYRRLPFKTQRILSLNPRLKNARALLAAADGVQLIGVGEGGRTEARVRGTGVWHTVLVGGAQPPQCTCTWFSEHQGQRGPCKHILAAQMQFV
ncbi:SWIM zinc finger domain-containing protein [Hymenobacter sp. HSC-4F20]|uniref:SWIM zinc finger family protein n=1 Tax=Hymenobacter sp. HSC-4F20 TaxID=2864135 RepID=UPI001C72D26F|nr:SWIM zinc finger family protein [Hymenobacter sp. HSC-4F20]MBX0292251.1 SWIM zinc finger domain-containing protein [Hymenobacter sp. HSC-4F20]